MTLDLKRGTTRKWVMGGDGIRRWADTDESVPERGHNQTNDQLMAMAAHRYCLGRRTYIVGACCEWLRANWDGFEANTQNVIVRDTFEALARDAAGDESDARDWTNLMRWASDRMTPEQREWVRDATRHLDDIASLLPPNT
jgi:hypothetical protein